MLPKGIVSILQTPFDEAGNVDFDAASALVDDAVEAGADGLICTGIAGEVSFLTLCERIELLVLAQQQVRGRVALIAGASDPDKACVRSVLAVAENLGLTACMVAVPSELYVDPRALFGYFEAILDGFEIPVMVQDFQLSGPGLPLEVIHELITRFPSVKGIKIETSPAGPKYTAVKKMLGEGFHVSGGWAVPQFIEAMDRQVDAMIPESSMVSVYKQIFRLYQSGERTQATTLFRQLLPVLAFTNQDVGNSICFFKHLLVEKGIFKTTRMRLPKPQWDAVSKQTAAELIELYLKLEIECGS